MKSFKVKITQGGLTLAIDVIAKSSIDALLSVAHSINANEPSRVMVRAV